MIPGRRRKRIILTARGEGYMYEEPRIQALARLQPIRVLDNGHVEDEFCLRGGDFLRRPIMYDHHARKRFQRRYYGSHSRRIRRDAEARRMGF